MSLTIFILTHIFIGLAAAFTAVGLWRRESGWAPFWFISRAGIGALCLLAGGAALVAGGHYRLSNLTPGEMHIVSALSVRLVVYLETCVVLIGVGAALRAFARADGHRAVAGKGSVAMERGGRADRHAGGAIRRLSDATRSFRRVATGSAREL